MIRTASARRRLSLVLAGLTGVAAAVACIWLTASLWETGQTGAEKANVLALPVGIVSAALALASIWLTVKGLRPGAATSQALQKLAFAVREDRQRFLDRALAVRWQSDLAAVRFADPAPTTVPEPVETVLLQWQAVTGADAGTIYDIAHFYQQQSSGRLVVLGPPGAGKTVLLSRLTTNLTDQILDIRASDFPAGLRVPVLFSLPSWQADNINSATSSQLACDLNHWITAKLIDDYGLEQSVARALVDESHILPVLDGLDEMDPSPTGTSGVASNSAAARPRAAAVIRALNDEVRAPVILACRELEYHRDIATRSGTSPTILNNARHISLRPLDAKAVTDYLTARFHDRDGRLRQRWQPLATALERGDPILDSLANPWLLFLAVTTYTDENSEPGELVNMTPEQLETHLLANLIPATVEHSEVARHHGWAADSVTRWLANMAEQHSRGSTRDILLPDLWRVAGNAHARWASAIISATPAAAMSLFLIIQGTSPGPRILGAWSALGCLILGAVCFQADAPLNRLDVNGMRKLQGWRRLGRVTSTYVVGNAIALAAFMALMGSLGWYPGVAEGLAGGLTVGLEVGAGIGILAGLAVGLKADIETVPSSTALARQCISYACVTGLMAGLLAGLLTGVLFGLTPQVYLAPVVVALTWGMFIGNGFVWVRYALGTWSAARQGKLPDRPARFLDWCLEVGLMRMSGNALQFRHGQLQDALSQDDTTLKAIGGTAQPS